MRVPMMRVGPVTMRMRLPGVSVTVAVLPLEGWIVRVVMMSIVVAMSVLVLELFVGVRVLVLLGEVQVQRCDEKESRDEGQRADAAIAQEPSGDGPDEGGYRKNGTGATGADRSLRSQVEPQAEAVTQT